MFCPKCGSAVGDSEQFCAKCGARLGRPTPRSLLVTFVEGDRILAEATIATDQDASITFGRERDNNIVVEPPSQTVSAHHGTFEVRNGQLFVVDHGSTNGLYYNGAQQTNIPLTIGDIVTVGMPQRGARRTIIIVGEGDKRWSLFDLVGRQTLNVGRAADNDLVLPDPTVSSYHARMVRDQQGFWYLEDPGSSNGTRVNGVFVSSSAALNAGAILMMGNSRLVFLDTCLLVVVERQGVEVVATNLVRYRTNRGVRRITTDHVSLRIKRGEFVAIVGGSGCGKSTLLNELNGSEPADEGSVLLDGTDLYANYEMLKSSIGYVPQQDIVYDNLCLSDMLAYAAKLRMQPDTTKEERAARVDEVIDLLELEFVRDNFIGNLSGGQKKRASIAVELLADPRLLFLDEPTSGLDPGIERKLMATLAEMAHEGRTIILVTHTTLNLHLCDQVVFLGAGGKLCYADSPQRAREFFGVSDFVDVYNAIGENPELWEQRFAFACGLDEQVAPNASQQQATTSSHRVPSFFSQFLTLSVRYAKLLANDRSRLALLLLQAPILAAFIGLVAGNDCFRVVEDTKSCLFALSCAAFWVGILDAIQEVCKERWIFRREYEGGMRLFAYLASKVVVLGLLCCVQSLLLIGVFMLVTGSPKDALVSAPVELFVSTFLTTGSAMSLGLFVSALFKNPDRAIAMAPLLIMPQILFSGLVFELEGVTEGISYAVNCRWSMEAYGTTANLNELDLAIYDEEIVIPAGTKELEDQVVEVPEYETEQKVDGVPDPVKVTVPKEERKFDKLEFNVPETHTQIDEEMYEHEAEDMYEHSMGHLLRSWGILLGFSLLAIAGCLITLALQVRR